MKSIRIEPHEKVLLYGIGNLGRQDDGVGVRLIQKLENVKLRNHVTLEANYQLNVEDALLISEFDVVVFIDASTRSEAVTPFSFYRLKALSESEISSHAMKMGTVLSLCEKLYFHSPRAFVLEVPGYEWGISEEITKQASDNLECAFQFILGEVECTKSLS